LVPDHQEGQQKGYGQQPQGGRTPNDPAQPEMVTILRTAITLLCGVGLYASLFMLRKSVLAAAGRLEEPSVVQSPRARLYGGVPNSAWGLAYYAALAASVWFASSRAVEIAVLCAVALAAVTSVVLAYSLLFVTRRPCPYCWTAHAVNWSLAVLTPWLLKTNILSNVRFF
ncbi:MAG: vitamin K epoxide reductase family protein, partial [Candidatus Eremiobacteraeota bacterium]|nr:vitamin K epoxide reductase family protein [Candidatus Eremiobacteraeota bacterium]